MRCAGGYTRRDLGEPKATELTSEVFETLPCFQSAAGGEYKRSRGSRTQALETFNLGKSVILLWQRKCLVKKEAKLAIEKQGSVVY